MVIVRLTVVLMMNRFFCLEFFYIVPGSEGRDCSVTVSDVLVYIIMMDCFLLQVAVVVGGTNLTLSRGERRESSKRKVS